MTSGSRPRSEVSAPSVFDERNEPSVGRARTGRWVGGSLVGAGLALTCGWWLRQHRSGAAHVWSPGAGEASRAGPLRVRVFGRGEVVVLLLHGLVSSGGTFGAAYDVLGQRARVVVPDLLGFGGSMDAVGSCDASAHIAALDAALEALDLDRHPVVVVGHSMGAGLALRWAAAHPDRVRGVVTLGAPLYRSDAEATERLREMGPMVALLAGRGWVSRTICELSCRHRYLASWLAVASQPELPVPVARAVSQHTWTSFSGSLDSLVRDTGWLVALDRLAGEGIPVVLAAGDGDPVPVPGQGAELARQFPSTRYETHPDADHLLPLTDPAWCRDLIEQFLICGSNLRLSADRLKGGHTVSANP